MYRTLCALAIGTSVFITSCGGGDGGETNYVANASPGGIWNGTDAVTGLGMLGLIDELGEFHFIRADGVQFVGSALTAANTMVASVESISAFGHYFPDGSTYGTGSFNGTVQERQSIAGEIDYVTAPTASGAHVVAAAAGIAQRLLVSFAFDNAYFESSSLAIIAGIYADANGTVVTISSNGDVFAQDATNGCVVNGTVSIIEASYNVYRVRVSYANCQGSSATLNGVTLGGLATLQDIAPPPEHVIAGVTGGNGSTQYAITYTLTRLSPPTS